MANGRPTTVVFDLGGVLVDWNPRHLYRKMFDDSAEMERFLAEVCTGAWNLEMDRGRRFTDAIDELASRHPGRRLHIEAFFSRWTEMVTGPIHGTVAILEELSSRDTPLFALSNWSVETFPLVRHDPAFAFFDRFERIFLSGELRLVKPEPAIYQHLLTKIGRAPHECFFIDDNEENAAAAEKLGLHAHRFRSPGDLRHELRRHGLLD